ncbi:hypothetical protein NECAME_03500 [Necator americanus]|uniref:Tc1-like transposase DDE domain-containing protein n=1 Tax=Necator americanus TaxID=51031 RepID=W2T5U9_NECAM|nr:hypothetical protein NECAME_03500 [Necator americanus]ETN76337.1 hypothetical protein NECAME_03500 [Necator americanus]
MLCKPLYQLVLQSSLLAFLKGRRRVAHVLQQDNAAVHVSRSIKDWLQRHHIQVIDWLASSPRCNPMENIWGIVVRYVYSINRPFSTVEGLKAAISNAWESIDDNMTQNLSSMHNRLLDVMRENGGTIDY